MLFKGQELSALKTKWGNRQTSIIFWPTGPLTEKHDAADFFA